MVSCTGQLLKRIVCCFSILRLSWARFPRTMCPRSGGSLWWIMQRPEVNSTCGGESHHQDKARLSRSVTDCFPVLPDLHTASSIFVSK